MVFSALVIMGALVVSQTASAGTLFRLTKGNPAGALGIFMQTSGVDSNGDFSFRCGTGNSTCYEPTGDGNYWTPATIFLTGGGGPIIEDDNQGELLSE